MNVREVAATEARARFAELLRQVGYGETVAVTRHGRTVAHLTPPPHRDSEAREAAVARFRAWRERRRPVGMTTDEILDLIREGRRFRASSWTHPWFRAREVPAQTALPAARR